MSTAVARRLMRLTWKGFVALLVIVASGLAPAGVANGADLAFPILFVPVYSQNENIQGAFTDTRISIMNPSKHCPVAIDPGCVGILTTLSANTEVEIIFFDDDEDFVKIYSEELTPFDVTVVTDIPNGTGTAIIINTLVTRGTGLPPIIALFHPLSAVVEIGVKLVAGTIPDPVVGSPPPYGTAALFALTASEAQLIPAIAGEFARVEVSAGALGAPILFGPEWETVIVETCLLEGFLRNNVFNDNERFLYNNIVPCTGIDSGFLSGPDLVIWTPDDGGLLGDPIGPAPVGGGNSLSPGYNRLGILVDSFGGSFFDFVLFHGQAFVIAPGGINRQAYSYNMPANFFRLLFVSDALAAAAAADPEANPFAVATGGVGMSVDTLTRSLCDLLDNLLRGWEVEGFGRICDQKETE